MAASETLSPIEIRQHNALTTARYEMSACEMDIVFSLLSKLTKHDQAGTIYEIRVQELMELTGRTWNYKQLLESTENLNSRVYHIDTGKTLLQVSLLASALYRKGEGTIELEISERMRPYLIDLKSNFTSYRLQAAFNLSSKYAKRIYQLASQWKDIGETKTYSLDEFKAMLKLKDPTGKEPEQYAQISALQKYVLDIATTQINEHTDLSIKYELLKKGRSYQSIKFYVSQVRPQQLPIPFELAAEDAKAQAARKHLENLGIEEPSLVQQILQSTTHIEALFSFIFKLKTDKIKATKNPGGLFLKMQGLR
ncbi:replication initiation protein (plasmid) [Hymenobacter sp. NBH84]|uniref:Replication initiation protein n=1 Tax=Hymenobacter citatus TaxID=2763506 RepID=A0ABR7MN16_9BACT|nr:MULTISPECIES: replication initiation protein [Hymenobacter]MBC6612450.1 replication initiation protein [Hymenobacter citatus]QNE42005.1 replication initiation protein [Hymenobacter sp. NBH84]